MDKDVELVEIAMDQAGLCEADNYIHEVRIQAAWRGDIDDLPPARVSRVHRKTAKSHAQRIRIYVLHEQYSALLDLLELGQENRVHGESAMG